MIDRLVLATNQAPKLSLRILFGWIDEQALDLF